MKLSEKMRRAVKDSPNYQAAEQAWKRAARINALMPTVENEAAEQTTWDVLRHTRETVLLGFSVDEAAAEIGRESVE